MKTEAAKQQAEILFPLQDQYDPDKRYYFIRGAEWQLKSSESDREELLKALERMANLEPETKLQWDYMKMSAQALIQKHRKQ